MLLTKGGSYTRTFIMVQSSDHLTGAAGKTVTCSIAKAGGSFAAPNGGATALEMANGWYKIAYNSTDLNTAGDLDLHATAPGCDDADLQDQVVTADLISATIEAQVWDAQRSSHIATGTFGQLGLGFLRDNTATAGAASSITLDAGASTTADFFKGALIAIYGGTGAGQAPRMISAYSTGRVATVAPPWIVTPDNTSKFIILAFDDPPIVGSDGRVLVSADSHTAGSTVAAVSADVGITQTGADKVWSTTVRALSSAGVQAIWDALTSALTTVGSIGKRLADNLNATISGQGNPTGSVVAGTNSATTFKTDRTETTNDYWKGLLLTITSGVLIDQVQKVSAYNGTTKEITVSAAFTGTPANGVTFMLVNR